MNSFQKEQITTFKRVSEAFREVGIPMNTKKLRKGIKNFRGALRDKFDFPSEELFFEIQGEDITLTKDLFSI